MGWWVGGGQSCGEKGGQGGSADKRGGGSARPLLVPFLFRFGSKFGSAKQSRSNNRQDWVLVCLAALPLSHSPLALSSDSIQLRAAIELVKAFVSTVQNQSSSGFDGGGDHVHC